MTAAIGVDDGRDRLRRRVGLALGIVGLAIALALVVQSWMTAGVRAWDAITYLAAGERLNAGHPLYALSPGDRWLWINPPYWTVPLLSPPPIAVFWRPLAAIPNEWGVTIWWIANWASILLVAVGLLRRLPLATGVALLLLAPSLAWELKVGNVNGLLLGGTAAAWLLARRGRDGWAGFLIAGLTVVKLWPAVLMGWFFTQRRWTAVRGFVGGGAALMVVSVLGAGLDAHFDYINVVRTTPPNALSLASLLAGLGINAPWIGYAIVAFALVEIWALRDRPELAYAVAVCAMVLGSPVININTPTVLLGALVPFAWPLASVTQPATTEISRGRTARAPSS
jgi:hypothetical protein